MMMENNIEGITLETTVITKKHRNFWSSLRRVHQPLRDTVENLFDRLNLALRRKEANYKMSYEGVFAFKTSERGHMKPQPNIVESRSQDDDCSPRDNNVVSQQTRVPPTGQEYSDGRHLYHEDEESLKHNYQQQHKRENSDVPLFLEERDGSAFVMSSFVAQHLASTKDEGRDQQEDYISQFDRILPTRQIIVSNEEELSQQKQEEQQGEEEQQQRHQDHREQPTQQHQHQQESDGVAFFVEENGSTGLMSRLIPHGSIGRGLGNSVKCIKKRINKGTNRRNNDKAAYLSETDATFDVRKEETVQDLQATPVHKPDHTEQLMNTNATTTMEGNKKNKNKFDTMISNISSTSLNIAMFNNNNKNIKNNSKIEYDYCSKKLHPEQDPIGYMSESIETDPKKLYGYDSLTRMKRGIQQFKVGVKNGIQRRTSTKNYSNNNNDDILNGNDNDFSPTDSLPIESQIEVSTTAVHC